MKSSRLQLSKFPYSLVNWEKFRSTMNGGKTCFHWEFCTHNYAQNFWPQERLTFWCFTQADNLWNKSTSSAILHIAMISWWTSSWSYVKFNIFSAIRNDFGHLLWVQIIEMNFNPFQPNVPFLQHWKRHKTFGFLTFSGCIEMEN